MKNELLNLQAEVENLEVREEDSRDKELLVEHCEALYGRLDDIHRHIKDNTMNFRRLRPGRAGTADRGGYEVFQAGNGYRVVGEHSR